MHVSVSIPQAVSTVATDGKYCAVIPELSLVSIPQAVSTVATCFIEVISVSEFIKVSIPQAVSTVATAYKPATGLDEEEFQYRKR